MKRTTTTANVAAPTTRQLLPQCFRRPVLSPPPPSPPSLRAASESVPRSEDGGGSSCASSPLRREALTTGIQTRHLVLDLDSTLVHTLTAETEIANYQHWVNSPGSFSSPGARAELLTRTVQFTLGDGETMLTVLRPGTFRFLEFSKFYFKTVSIWSAGQKEYVDKVVSFLFPPHVQRSSVVFTRDDCAFDEEDATAAIASSPSDRTNFTTFSKPLTRIVKHLVAGGASAPLSDTLILDDRSDIAVHNVDNLVMIPPFEPIPPVPRKRPMSQSIRSRLEKQYCGETALANFTKWLMSDAVLCSPDVRKLPKDNIF